VPPVVEVNGVHELAVDIELKLFGRVVADPHRLRAQVPREVGQFPLRQLGTTVDAVHHLHRAGGTMLPGGGVLEDEAHEGVGLAAKSQPQKRVNAESRVSDPDKSVVPVALPADLLRQAGRRRCHNGAGRGVGEQLQRQC
jgi:hypothetical protein